MNGRTSHHATQNHALRHRWTLAIGLAALLLLSACGAVGTGGNNNGSTTGATSEPATSEGGDIVIGVIMPLSGQTAQSGQNSLRGVELIAQQINDAGGIKSMGGAKIKLVKRDSTSDPANAGTQAQQLVSSAHPLAIVGAYASSLTLAVAPITEQAKIPVCTTSFTDDLTSKGYKYMFQIAPKASNVGKAQMDYAAEISTAAGHPIQNVAIVFTDDAYGTSQAKGLKASAEAHGFTVSLYEPYSKSITDASPLAQKINNAHPDALFPISYIPDGIQLIRALRASGSTVPVVAGVGGFVTADFQKGLGDVVNGILSVDTSSPDVYGALGDAYKTQYGQFMPQEGHDNAACLSAIAQALEEHPTRSSEDLAQTMHSMDFNHGAAATMPGGHVKFDETGANTIVKPLMVQWQNGELVAVWPADVATHKPDWQAQK